MTARTRATAATRGARSAGRRNASGKRTRWAAGGGAALALALTAAVIAPAAHRMWYGKPYPEADPDATAERLQGHSWGVYDALALPESVTEMWNSLDAGVCYYRGYQYLAHWDEPEKGVISLGHSWSVEGVGERTARSSLERLRERLESEGWELTHDLGRENADTTSIHFRYEHPENGLKINMDWHDFRGRLFVDVYAPCARIPDGHPKRDVSSPTWYPYTPF